MHFSTRDQSQPRLPGKLLHGILQSSKPSSATLCYYITLLTHQFQSPKSIHNYISKIRFLHKQLRLTLEAIDSAPLISLLKAADIIMRTSLLRHLHIRPDLLHHLYLLTTSLRPLGSAMKVCLAFGFFAMLRQSNLTPPTHALFERHLLLRGHYLGSPRPQTSDYFQMV